MQVLYAQGCEAEDPHSRGEAEVGQGEVGMVHGCAQQDRVQ